MSQLSHTRVLENVSQDTGLAVAVGVKDANVIWQHIYQGIASIYALEGTPGREKRMANEFKEEFGIDLKRDFLDNVVGAAWIVPSLTRERDLENKMVLAFEVRDSNRARASLEKMIAHASKKFRVNFATRNLGSATAWQSNEVNFVLHYDTLLVMSPRLDLQATWKKLRDNGRLHYDEHLRKVHGGEFFLVWNYDKMLPGDFEQKPITLGIGFNEREYTLKLRSHIDFGEIVQLVLKTMEGSRSLPNAKPPAVEPVPVPIPVPIKPEEWEEK